MEDSRILYGAFLLSAETITILISKIMTFLYKHVKFIVYALDTLESVWSKSKHVRTMPHTLAWLCGVGAEGLF